ncbi:MAG: mannose-1-phosphate guanylyltransferase [Bacteriovoracaceae bacterium]
MSKVHGLIMAGGQGTRLWPESTSKRPKQYLSLFDEESLIYKTLKRLEGIVETEDRFVITVENQRSLVIESSKEQILEKNLIFEPNGRNTAPCIYLSLVSLLKNNGASPDDVVLILPSDSIILNVAGFHQSLKEAVELASSKDQLVTIGIKPHFPHTGYGYIKRGEKWEEKSHRVKEFKEKPDFETAKKYLESGEFYWNAGMFVGKISTFLEEFQTHASEYSDLKNELWDALGSDALPSVYEKLPATSLDYAIMEKSSNISVVEASFDWNDLGAWDALEVVAKKEEENWRLKAEGITSVESKNNIVYTPGKQAVLMDVENLVVVSNDRVVAVFPKSSSQKIKEVVSKLKGTDLI